jgi:ribonuclease J
VPIRNLQNAMAERGVRIHTDREHPGIHVSGHPCRDELKEMYQWARPAIAVPTHGERRHILEHVAFARDMQIGQAIAPRNGDMIRLAPGRAEVVDEVPAGRLYVDGNVIVPANSDSLRERRHAAYNGVLSVSMALDGKGRLVSGPQVRGLGLPGDEEYPLEEALDDLADTAETALKNLKSRDVDEEIESSVRRAVRKAALSIWDRKPAVEVTVLRV